MTHASVFSGIGGPEVAAAMLGWQNLFHCEINPFGRKVLDYWFPNSKSYEDITKTDFREWRGRVNVLTGGFPCQPFSCAGKRRGAEDDRYLWPHMHRCINEIQPDWVVAENVAGILTMVEQGEVSSMASQATLFDEGDTVHGYQLRETFTLQRICDDLESHGYTVQPILIPACGVGAPHRRDRVFIIANSNECANLRATRKAESKDGRSRMEERNAVRKSDIADNVRPKDSDDAIADTFGSREGTSRKGCGIEGDGCNGNQQPSMWRATPEWYHRLSSVLRNPTYEVGERWRDFPSVSAIHRGNDGIPIRLDGLSLPFNKWKREALKAYGNAIVPQVMYEIFRAIEIVEQREQR